MNKRQDKGLATRQHILAVATNLFTDPGYEATSIEAILGEAGVSRGALYHHFASKEELFAAVFEAIEKDMTAQSIEASLKVADPVERLRAGCRFFLRTPLLNSFRQIALIDAPSVLGWQKWRDIESRYGLGALKAALQAAIVSRGRKQEASEELAHMLLAAMIEGALLIARATDKDRARKAAAAAIDTLINGIVG